MTKTRIFVIPDFEVAYVNSPRNCCSTIKTIILRSLGRGPAPKQLNEMHRAFRKGKIRGVSAYNSFSTVSNSYFKFTVVRNPFDRVVSFYTGKVKNNQNSEKREYYGLDADTSFTDFVRRLDEMGLDNFETHLCEQFRGFRVPELDYLVHFENFEEELEPVLDRLDYQGDVPVKNASRRKPYLDYYTEETRNIVKNLYQTDLEKLGYEF